MAPLLRPGRRRHLTVLATAAGVLGIGLLGVGIATQQPDPPSLPPRAAVEPDLPSPESTPPPERSAGSEKAAPDSRLRSTPHAEGLSGPTLLSSRPREIRIPAIDVRSTLERLDTNTSGKLDVPRDPDRAGWFTGSPTPGAPGPAVIAGHVTWDRDPVVFFDLADLRTGDRIEVTRADGTIAEFDVTGLEQYPKVDFATEKVYGAIDHAGLRLITCGGEYDDAQRRYSDNLVVFAKLTGVRK